MSTTPNPTQSELSKASLPVKKSLVEVLTIDPANLKNEQVQSEWPWLGQRAALALALITLRRYSRHLGLAVLRRRGQRDDREFVPTAWLVGTTSHPTCTEYSRHERAGRTSRPFS
jgi:hypothetical protein